MRACGIFTARRQGHERGRGSSPLIGERRQARAGRVEVAGRPMKGGRAQVVSVRIIEALLAGCPPAACAARLS